MNIDFTFRQMEPSDAVREYSRTKVAKLQKFLRQPLRARVTFSLDKLKHVAEMQISAGGEHLEAKEATEDMYASIDKVIHKLERQITSHKGQAQSKKRRAAGLKSGPLAAPPPEGLADEDGV